jgi:hypothetical protein
MAALDASFHAVRAGEGQAPFDGPVIIQATLCKNEEKIWNTGQAPDPVGRTLAHAGQEGLARLPGEDGAASWEAVFSMVSDLYW